jgi:hypothetical protein
MRAKWTRCSAPREKWLPSDLFVNPLEGRALLVIAHEIPTFIGDDIEAMRDAARANLPLFATFSLYQRMFRFCRGGGAGGKPVSAAPRLATGCSTRFG